MVTNKYGRIIQNQKHTHCLTTYRQIQLKGETIRLNKTIQSKLNIPIPYKILTKTHA